MKSEQKEEKNNRKKQKGVGVESRSRSLLNTPAFKIVTKAMLNVTRSLPTIDTVKLEWNAKYKLTLKRCPMLIFNETLSLKALYPDLNNELHRGRMLRFFCRLLFKGSKTGID